MDSNPLYNAELVSQINALICIQAHVLLEWLE